MTGVGLGIFFAGLTFMVLQFLAGNMASGIVGMIVAVVGASLAFISEVRSRSAQNQSRLKQQVQNHHDYYVLLYRLQKGKLGPRDAEEYLKAMKLEKDGVVDPLQEYE